MEGQREVILILISMLAIPHESEYVAGGLKLESALSLLLNGMKMSVISSSVNGESESITVTNNSSEVCDKRNIHVI